LPGSSDLVTGTLRAHARGFGFVQPADASLDDIYIHRENMSTALDGDTVLVRCLPSPPHKRAKGPEGEIVKVVKRRSSQIVGTLRKTGHFHYVLPDNPAIYQDLLIPDDALGKARVGDKVVAKITEWESKHLNPEGAVVKVLGPSGDIKTDIAAVAARYDAPFPDARHKAGPRRFPWCIPFAEPEAGNAADQERCFHALPGLGKPVHFVWGDADPVFPWTWGERWARSIPGATLDRVAGAGHFLQQDAPEDVAALLLQRLGRR